MADRLNEYQRNAYGMFDQLKSNIQRDIVYQIIHVSFQYEQYLRQVMAEQQQRLNVAQQAGMSEEQTKSARTVRKNMPKLGRNDKCPCGSGRKFKDCHLGHEGELIALLQAGNGGAQRPAAPTVGAQLATGQSPAASAAPKQSQQAPRGGAARPTTPAGGQKGNGKSGKQPQAQRGKGTPAKKK